MHSEQLAIVYALLHANSEGEMFVIKNLRICGDCHLFVKLVSKFVDNRFVIRDATRFHHFQGAFAPVMTTGETFWRTIICGC